MPLHRPKRQSRLSVRNRRSSYKSETSNLVRVEHEHHALKFKNMETKGNSLQLYIPEDTKLS